MLEKYLQSEKLPDDWYYNPIGKVPKTKNSLPFRYLIEEEKQFFKKLFEDDNYSEIYNSFRKIERPIDLKAYGESTIDNFSIFFKTTFNRRQSNNIHELFDEINDGGLNISFFTLKEFDYLLNSIIIPTEKFHHEEDYPSMDVFNSISYDECLSMYIATEVEKELKREDTIKRETLSYFKLAFEQQTFSLEDSTTDISHSLVNIFPFEATVGHFSEEIKDRSFGYICNLKTIQVFKKIFDKSDSTVQEMLDESINDFEFFVDDDFYAKDFDSDSLDIWNKLFDAKYSKNKKEISKYTKDLNYSFEINGKETISSSSRIKNVQDKNSVIKKKKTNNRNKMLKMMMMYQMMQSNNKN